MERNRKCLHSLQESYFASDFVDFSVTFDNFVSFDRLFCRMNLR